AGQSGVLVYNARLAASASLGTVTADARAAATGGGGSLSSPSSFATTRWLVQTPARVTVLSFQTPAQVSLGQSIVVTMVLNNAGQAPASIETAAIRFLGSGGVSRDLDYRAVLATGNPTAAAGLATGATPPPARTYLRFNVDVKPAALTEVVAIDGSFRGRDVNSGAVVLDDTATTRGQWSVQTAAGLVIASVQAPSVVSQGQTTRVVMNLENPGQAPATLVGASLRFLDEAGNDLTGSYGSTFVLPGPFTVQGQSRLAVAFNVFVGAAAQRGRVVLDARATARDDRTGQTIELFRASQPAIWTVRAPAALSLVALSARPTTLSRGGSTVLSMTVRNDGESDLRLVRAAFQLFALDTGAERTGQFVLRAAGSLPSVIAGQTTTDLVFTATAALTATAGPVRAAASVEGRDVNSGFTVQAASQAFSEPILSVEELLMGIVSPRAADLYYFDDTVPLVGWAQTRSGAVITGSGLTWSSNVSGALGSGPSCYARLGAGTHTLRLAAASGSALTSSTTVAIKVEAAPAPVSTLSLSGALVRTGTLSPLPTGFTLTLTDGARGVWASGTAAGGRYSLTLAAATASLAAGDTVTAQIRDLEGLRRATSPAALVLRSRDLVLGSRTQDFAAADLSEGLLSLSRGLNLVGLPLEPSTTGTDRYLASDLAVAAGATFVARMAEDPVTHRMRMEGYTRGSSSGRGFPIEANEGYLLDSPADKVLRLRGTPWSGLLLYRKLGKGVSFIGLPLGVPAGLRSDNLLQRATGSSFVGRLLPDSTGMSRFEIGVRDGATFPLETGRGYLIGVSSGGDMVLPAGQ
ncbi:MAG: hypothetical protein HY814_13535, partial [Candidatus Riflebacteria bacterium]|nr:hypothetical protein [Candidatus Riflebacteria bacterium]